MTAGDLYGRLKTRLRPPPATRYVHPRATGIVVEDSEANLHVDVAQDSAPNHLRWIADLCRPHLGQRVLDVGAGTGAITAQYVDGRDLHVVEVSDWCVAALRQRFAQTANVTVHDTDLHELRDGGGFDSIVMINVLEHIADDVAALRSLRSLLRPDGRIVLYVPALNCLYGEFDRRAGHFRRYAAWRLREVVMAAELRPVVVRYVNALAVPGWLLFSRSGGMRNDPADALALWDRLGVPLNRMIESRVRLPFGLNVICVAQRD